MDEVIHSWPVSQLRLNMISAATEEDEQLQRVRKLNRIACCNEKDHTWKSELQGQLRKDKMNTFRPSLGAQRGLKKVWPPKQVLKIDTAPDVRIRTISRFRRGDINAGLSAENVHTRQCGGLEYQQTLNTKCKHATIVRQTGVHSAKKRYIQHLCRRDRGKR